MKTPPFLQVTGTGIVHPAGCSLAALRAPLPEPTLEALLSNPSVRVPVRRVAPGSEALARWQKEPRLRRASPLAHYLVEAVAQALLGAGDLPRHRVGLICAMGSGSIACSRKFYADVLQRGRRFASPALFPETVYNSPVSHVASVHGLTSACTTLVGDETAWVEALRVAQVWLARGTVDAVVVSAGEEADPIVSEVFHAAGWFRRGLVAAEGAGAILVRAAPGESGAAIRPHPRTHAFRTRADQAAAWEAMLYELKNSDAEGSPRPVFFQPPLAPPTLEPKLAARGVQRLPDGAGSAFAAATAWGLIGLLQSCSGPSHLFVPGANAAVGAIEIG